MLLAAGWLAVTSHSGFGNLRQSPVSVRISVSTARIASCGWHPLVGPKGNLLSLSSAQLHGVLDCSQLPHLSQLISPHPAEFLPYQIDCFTLHWARESYLLQITIITDWGCTFVLLWLLSSSALL